MMSLPSTYFCQRYHCRMIPSNQTTKGKVFYDSQGKTHICIKLANGVPEQCKRLTVTMPRQLTMRDKGFEIRDGTQLTNSHWKNLTGQKQIILVDFDHTITKQCLACHPYTQKLDREVQFLAKEVLTELHMTYQIWIFTGNYNYLNTACPVNRAVPAIKQFLRQHGIPFDRVLQIKPPAAFIIDDRAVWHTSWDTTLRSIRERESKTGEKPKCACPCGCTRDADLPEDLCHFCMETHEELRRQ